MPDSQIVNFVAICRAKPEHVAALKAAFEAAIEPTRQESGCLGYRLHQNRADPAEFVFYESWADQAALQDHFASRHNRRLIDQIGPLMAEPATLLFLEQIV